MKRDKVPQDCSKTYGGHHKMLYATGSNGQYTHVQSSGWNAEELATQLAIEEIVRQAENAWQAAREGSLSPLPYHMYNQRMDISLLSQTTGLFKWRIRRHFQPSVFSHLSDKTLSRYADALGVSIHTLLTLPDRPQPRPALQPQPDACE